MGQYAMTGGATGIGAAIRRHLVADGHEVMVVDIRNADIEADLSGVAGRRTALEALGTRCAGGLDGFIACAGLGAHVPDHEAIVSVNYFGATELIEGVRELVAARGGSVIVISSNSAPMASDEKLIDLLLAGDESGARAHARELRGHEVYSATKMAVTRWMRRQVSSYAREGVRMNAIAPGLIETPLSAEAKQDPDYAQAMSEFERSIPIGRPGVPEDIAAAADFLLSPQAAFVAGSVLFVDGGHDAMLRADRF